MIVSFPYRKTRPYGTKLKKTRKSYREASMNDRGLLDLIICRMPGVGIREKAELCTKFEKEEEITILSKKDIEKILDRRISRSWNMDTLRFAAEKDEKMARLRGIMWESVVSPSYPPLLREIFDPPTALFYRGKLPDPERPMAAIVGTRRPGSAAAAQAFEMGMFLGRAGISVVSGLALGIDAMAHRGNVEGGGATVAVLGSGVDEIYPVSNRPLARRILETGGAIVSEYPPGTGPRPWRFPARNRIISALARGTVIVEAPEKSGALITARMALEQGRDLWVASAGLAGPRSAGTARLAAEGAGVLRSAAGILKEWGMVREGEEERPDSGAEGIQGGAALAASLARSLGMDVE
jgi:DNA processing protein